MTSILAAAPPAPRRLPWATLASLMLHGGLLLAVALVLTQRQTPVPPEPAPIAVEMVSPAEFAALQPVDPAPPPLATTAPSPGAAPAAETLAPTETPATPAPFTSDATGTLTAQNFYAAQLLQQPEMQRIRQGLRGFADSERLIQICNIEALEQIRRAAPDFAPDTMVAYAMADLVSSGLTLTASGGAFRSRRRWYGIAFNCTAAPGYEAVTAFDFTLGDPIPESEWEAHSLNAADEDE